MKHLDDSRICALVSLLSDDSKVVSQGARSALKNIGAQALPYLADASNGPDARLRVRARFVLEDVRIHLLEKRLFDIGHRLGKDQNALEDGCVLLALSRYPDLDEGSIRAALDAMADDLQTRIVGVDHPMTVAQVLSRFLAGELGFSGNQRNYYDPDNSYLNRVLERRTGIPIALATIYLFVARRLSLPLFGIGLPGHFILRLGLHEPAVFIDAFEAGRIQTKADCIQRLSDGKGGYDPGLLMPMNDGAILLRIIRNLQLVYRNLGELHQFRVLERLKKVLLREEVQRKDGGGHSSRGESNALRP